MPRPIKPHLCKHCGETDPTMFYYKMKQCCKACQREQTRLRYYNMTPEQVEKRLEKQKEWREKSIFRTAINHANHRAKKQFKKCSITEEHLEELFLEQDRRCYYTGVELTKAPNTPNTARLRRKNLDGPYTPENVVLISNALYQLLQHVRTEQELFGIVKKIFYNHLA